MCSESCPSVSILPGWSHSGIAKINGPHYAIGIFQKKKRRISYNICNRRAAVARAMLLLVLFVLHVVLLVVVLVLLVLLLLLLLLLLLVFLLVLLLLVLLAAKNHRTSENRWPIIHLIRMSFYIVFLIVILLQSNYYNLRP